MTEKEAEVHAAVCLCGAAACRGSFLSLVNSGPYQQVRWAQQQAWLGAPALPLLELSASGGGCCFRPFFLGGAGCAEMHRAAPS